MTFEELQELARQFGFDIREKARIQDVDIIEGDPRGPVYELVFAPGKDDESTIDFDSLLQLETELLDYEQIEHPVIVTGLDPNRPPPWWGEVSVVDYASLFRRKQLTDQQLSANRAALGKGQDPPYVGGWEIIPGLVSIYKDAIKAFEALGDAPKAPPLKAIPPEPSEWQDLMPNIAHERAYEAITVDGKIIGYAPVKPIIDAFYKRLVAKPEVGSLEDNLKRALLTGDADEIEKATAIYQYFQASNPDYILSEKKFEASQATQAATAARAREKAAFDREQQLFDMRQKEIQTALDVQKAAIELAQSPGDWLNWWYMTQGGPDRAVMPGDVPRPEITSDMFRQFGQARFPARDTGMPPPADEATEAEWQAAALALAQQQAADAAQQEEQAVIDAQVTEGQLTQAQPDKTEQQLRQDYADLQATARGAGFGDDDSVLGAIQAGQEAAFAPGADVEEYRRLYGTSPDIEGQAEAQAQTARQQQFADEAAVRVAAEAETQRLADEAAATAATAAAKAAEEPPYFPKGTFTSGMTAGERETAMNIATGVPGAAPGVRTVSQGTPQFSSGLNWLRTLFRGGQPPPARHVSTLPGAPPFPTAQTLKRLLPSQRAAFQSRVKSLGIPWQDYEAQMVAQRPKTRRQPGQTFRIAPNIVRA